MYPLQVVQRIKDLKVMFDGFTVRKETPLLERKRNRMIRVINNVYILLVLGDFRLIHRTPGDVLCYSGDAFLIPEADFEVLMDAETGMLPLSNMFGEIGFDSVLVNQHPKHMVFQNHEQRSGRTIRERE